MPTDDTSPATLLPITHEDFMYLRAAARTLDRNLVLSAETTEDGDGYISVETEDRFYGPTRVEGQDIAHVIRNEAGWAVEGPEGGCRQFEAGAIEAVATYLAKGDEL
jgi:hypothetical protein